MRNQVMYGIDSIALNWNNGADFSSAAPLKKLQCVQFCDAKLCECWSSNRLRQIFSVPFFIAMECYSFLLLNIRYYLNGVDALRLKLWLR